MTTPRLGGETGWVRTCTREIGAHLCSREATIHIMWDADGNNSLTCDEHFGEALGWSMRDSHIAGAACSMPGAVWDYDEKRCLVEDLDDSIPDLEANAEMSR